MQLYRHGCLCLDAALFCCLCRVARTTPLSEREEVLVPSFSVLFALFSQGGVGVASCEPHSSRPNPLHRYPPGLSGRSPDVWGP